MLKQAKLLIKLNEFGLKIWASIHTFTFSLLCAMDLQYLGQYLESLYLVLITSHTAVFVFLMSFWGYIQYLFDKSITDYTCTYNTMLRSEYRFLGSARPLSCTVVFIFYSMPVEFFLAPFTILYSSFICSFVRFNVCLNVSFFCFCTPGAYSRVNCSHSTGRMYEWRDICQLTAALSAMSALQWASFWACVPWEMKFSRSAVEGLNLLDNKDAAASSVSLWITALILPLQNKHDDVGKMKGPQTSSRVVLTVSKAVNVSKRNSRPWIYIQLWPCKVTYNMLHNPLLLLSASMFTFPNKPQLPGSSTLFSSVITAKFITSTKGHSLFSLPVLPAVAAAACHHTVTLQMEPGIHIIKTKMLGHNS